jgi:hypothetical protein
VADPVPEWGAPRARRQRWLVAYLRVATGVATGLALAGLALDGGAARTATAASVIVLAGAPLVRCAWLLVRWIRVGDGRYALVAGGVLVIVGAGAVAATLTA